MGRLDEKVVIVTGASRGQGAAEARLFAAEGARVALTDIVDAPGEELAATLGEQGHYWHLDVTSEENWTDVTNAVAHRWGRVDGLVNNAGLAITAPLAAMTLEDYRRVVDVNQVGVFLGMRSVVPLMAARAHGSIVNISSIEGMIGIPFTIAYCASKFAVRGMTKVAAIELGILGIRVNSIHPGGVDTDMLRLAGGQADLGEWFAGATPLGRISTPDEVAAMAAFLVSDESSYCTGSEFVVDGGLTAGIGVQALTGRPQEGLQKRKAPTGASQAKAP